MYQIRIKDFEGPMDLLLHLIYKNELDISEISVSAIASEYLSYVEQIEAESLDVAGEFLVMAATLALIKSKSLLPGAAGSPDDPRIELVQKLREYKKYRELSLTMGSMEENGEFILPRGIALEVTEDVETDIDFEGGLYDLAQAYVGLLAMLKLRKNHEITISSINIMEQMEKIFAYIVQVKRVDFMALCSLCLSRLEMVVSFVGLLELTRLGRITLEAEEGRLIACHRNS